LLKISESICGKIIANIILLVNLLIIIKKGKKSWNQGSMAQGCESNLTQFQGLICTTVAGNNAFYRNTII
jgi:hypothetical protein